MNYAHCSNYEVNEFDRRGPDVAKTPIAEVVEAKFHWDKFLVTSS